MTIQIQPELVSLLAISGAALCVFTIRKLRFMVRSSAIAMFQAGMVIISSALLTFSGLYFYIASSAVSAEVRQFSVRLLLVYLFGAINIWQIILLRWGKTL